MKARITLSVFALVVVFCGAAYGDSDLIGRATVIDGDTLEIHNTRIRLHGIDAPESGQACSKHGKTYRCGQHAALALSDMISNAPVRCQPKGTDRYKRILAECFSRSVNLNAAMVKAGWALAYRQYSKAYIPDEDDAKAQARGMWGGNFQPAWEYRKNPTKDEQTQNHGCMIKGNINSKGRRIYHLPGTTSYARTRITKEKGERWFCSESDAVAAGWKPAR